MGSVREGAEAMGEVETELGVANEEGVPAGVPAPANPLPNQMPGTPPGPPPKTPVEEPDAPGLPSVDAVAESHAAKKAKKARLEETQENLAQLTELVKEAMQGMKELKESVQLNNQQQQQLQSELDKLAAQMSGDSVSIRVIYNTLNEFQRSLTNGVWQLAGGKRDSQTSCKEVFLRMEDFMKQCATRLLESKNETRAQNAVTVTSVKEVTSAIRGLEQAIRAGTEQNAATAAPAVPAGPAAPAAPGTGTLPGAPAVEVNPPAPKAAPMGGGATVAPSTATATVGAPAVGTMNPPADAAMMPGYAAGPAMMYPTPPAGGPIFHAAGGHSSAPPSAPSAPRAGRIRVALRDGSVAARAVSPHGRLPTGVTPEWSNEYGLGTVTCGGYVYRVLPDSFLDGSVALN